MSRPLLVITLIGVASVAFFVFATTFHLNLTPASQRGGQGTAPSAQASDLLTVPLLRVPTGDLVCLYIKNSDTPCALEFHPSNKSGLIKLGVFDHPGSSVLPSPDKSHILLIAEEKVTVLSSDSFAVVFERSSPPGYAFGTYDAFPSFYPKGRWISTTTIELPLYAADTLEPYDNAPAALRPMPVRSEQFSL